MTPLIKIKLYLKNKKVIYFIVDMLIYYIISLEDKKKCIKEKNIR